KIIIDGCLDDWPPGDTLHFKNGNNSISALCQWDKKNLYFGIIVKDEELFGPAHDSLFYWWYDCIQIYLDMDRDRSSLRKVDDIQITIGVKDTFTYNLVDFEKGIKNQILRDGMICKVKASGTINDNSDKDTGYVIEAAMDWNQFNKKPLRGMAIGFDIFNIDNDYGGLVRISRGWSGTERYNNNNPSEWGTLILSGNSSSVFLLLSLIIAILLCFLIYIRLFRRKIHAVEKYIKTPHSTFQNSIMQYLENNYENANLNLEQIGKALELQKDYFRQKFKTEFGVNFSEYLNHFRLEKADSLIKQMKLPILDIAFMVGFKSHENFTRLFKKYYGTSPTKARNSLTKKKT
ncbi:MAG: helix-turn-helix domain-containing protein, partial [bacterium]